MTPPNTVSAAPRPALSADVGADAGISSSQRWTIVGLLSASITINLLDRQVFSVLASELRGGSSNGATPQYGYAAVAFNAGMMVGQIPVGSLMDRVGTKVGLALIFVVWSVIAMAHALGGPGYCRRGDRARTDWLAARNADARCWTRRIHPAAIPDGREPVWQLHGRHQGARRTLPGRHPIARRRLLQRRRPVRLGHRAAASSSPRQHLRMAAWRFVIPALVGSSVAAAMARDLPRQGSDVCDCDQTGGATDRGAGSSASRSSCRTSKVLGLFLIRVFTGPITTFYWTWLPLYLRTGRGDVVPRGRHLRVGTQPDRHGRQRHRRIDHRSPRQVDRFGGRGTEDRVLPARSSSAR